MLFCETRPTNRPTLSRPHADDNEGSSSDTAPLFQMAGDGRSTDDITLPILFLFHKEGNILLEALKEYREVEVLLSDKARDRGTPPPPPPPQWLDHPSLIRPITSVS